MKQFLSLTILTCLPYLVRRTAAHGHVSNIVVNGVYYRGWDPSSDPYNTNPPIAVGWGTPNLSNGFVTPDSVDTDSIICHTNATNARGHATVAAGDKIYLQWVPNPWPESHHGPVIDYLANCGDSCETVDKSTLKFFKISGVGLVDGSTPPGYWADDQLISNGNGWLVQIPPTIAPGNYVLRHEIIALHGAGSENGAQLYPQCINLRITGSGTAQPSGVLGVDLYSARDPGILINIYQSLSTYIVPGPTLIPQAVSISQSSSAITATGTPTSGSGSGPATTTTTTIRMVTSTTTSATTTSSGSSSTQVLYGQCGGNGWAGPTMCVAGATCTYYNAYYSQCVPA
ncbi:glycosyl hydrolase family 61-domain-containing protein [Aspergillus ambiguus]|uniref:glycosyl hydrolase family 61-domain-containing protein n=1 Tax=Aspergillus ambiguus TaxID=176160 RepID=UPI003CCDB328